MVINTPLLNLPKGENTDDAGTYLNGTIAGGGLHEALDILDQAVLLTGAQTLQNKTLVTPIIASFTNAQHGHVDAATGGAIGSGATLTSPSFAGTPVLASDVLQSSGATSLIRARNISNLADAGLAQFAWATTNAPIAMALVVADDSTTALVALHGANNLATVIAQDGFNAFTSTKDTVGKSNIYWSAVNNRYEVQNLRGTLQGYAIWFIGARS